MRSRGRWAALLAVVALSGCGDDARTAPRSALVDPAQDPPINALGVDPGSGEVLLSTNKGLFRIDTEEDRAERVESTVSDGKATSPVGNFLAFTFEGPGRLVGSGHPDEKGQLPEFLGFMRSNDGGRTWRIVSRPEIADLHVLRLRHERVYAFDAVLGALLVSDDGGREWTEGITPHSLILDFVVDPEDPDRILASDEDQVYRSTNGGGTWRPVLQAEAARMSWPAPDRLYRLDRDGTAYLSADGGESWKPRGQLEGEPWKLESLGGERLLAALSDGALSESGDGGGKWEKVFTP